MMDICFTFVCKLCSNVLVLPVRADTCVVITVYRCCEGDVGAPAWVLLSSHALEFTFCLLNHSRQQLSTSQVKTKS